MVSISPTISPAALSRLISPASPDLLATVNVWVPAVAEVQSGAQPVLVTVMAIPAVVAAGRQRGDRRPGGEGRDRDQDPGHRPRAPSGEALPLAGGRGAPARGAGSAGFSAAFRGVSAGLTAGPAVTNAGMTTAR